MKLFISLVALVSYSSVFATVNLGTRYAPVIATKTKSGEEVIKAGQKTVFYGHKSECEKALKNLKPKQNERKLCFEFKDMKVD